jgi:hypothetical protein
MTFCNCIRLVAAVMTIGGALPVLPGVASSWGLTSVPEELVSMLDALRGAKKFRVGTVLEVVFTAAESAVGTAFFKVGADSLELCRLPLLTSLNPSTPRWSLTGLLGRAPSARS